MANRECVEVFGLIYDLVLDFLLLHAAIPQPYAHTFFNSLQLQTLWPEHQRREHGTLSAASVAQGNDEIFKALIR